MGHFMRRVLFVCLGNICRSPSAEGIMKYLVDEKGLGDEIDVESAGTGGWHIGELPDARARKYAEKRGYKLNSRAQQFDANHHFKEFDYIVAMDNSNFDDIQAQDRKEKYSHKVFKMTEFCKKEKVSEVPDPYYGGVDHFEEVLDILEDACDGFLEKIKKDLKH